MSLYLVKGKYSNAAFKGMVDSPQDRETAARKLFAAVGVDMQSVYSCEQCRDCCNCRK